MAKKGDGLGYGEKEGELVCVHCRTAGSREESVDRIALRTRFSKELSARNGVGERVSRVERWGRLI